ncbi:MAG TPA: caspase family protein [Roseiarcus sp.]|nr:caspase family protein [Roseiarcus sp.]
MRYRFLHPLVAALLAIGVALCLHSPALAGGRVALVLGNSKYQAAPALENPANDAADVAKALRTIGFEVIEERDGTRDAMAGAMRDFAQRIRTADIALFFYAGHGLQMRGENYLIPVDAKIEDEADVRFSAINLKDLQQEMDGPSRANIIILDACRSNPFEEKLTRGRGSAARGLQRLETAGVGSLIVFSTQPDNIALDGSGRNSPFTSALLKYISAPGLEVRQMISRVRGDVLQATNQTQVPWDNSSLVGDVYLASSPAAAAPAPAAASAPVASAPAATDRTVFVAPVQPAPAQTAPAPQRPTQDAAAAAQPAHAQTAQTTQAPPPAQPAPAPQRPTQDSAAAAQPAHAQTTQAPAPAQPAPVAPAVVAKIEPTVLPPREGALSGPTIGAARECAKIATPPAPLSVPPVAAKAKIVDWSRAIEVCEQAVKENANDPRLRYLLGHAYYKAQNYPQAARYYQIAADAGLAEANDELGVLFVMGLGVNKDYQRAFDLFNKAAIGGSATGMSNLGTMYANGFFIEQNQIKALAWYERSIAVGNALALPQAGEAYFNGKGTPPDYPTAARYFRQAGDLGDGYSLKFLALMYERGLLGPPNPIKAAELRARAAEVDPDSQNPNAPPPRPFAQAAPLVGADVAPIRPFVRRGPGFFKGGVFRRH